MAGRDEILALTFTNKAADEIKERLNNMLGTEDIFSWMGTFHSISYKILRIFVQELSPDYKKGFTIYDSNDQTKLLKETIKYLDLDINQHPPALIKTIIDNLKNSRPYDEWNIEDKNRKNIIETYQRKLKENNSMDFGDLILNCYQLVSKNKKVRDYLRKTFKYNCDNEFMNELENKINSYGYVVYKGDYDEEYEWLFDEDLKYCEPNFLIEDKIIRYFSDYTGTKITIKYYDWDCSTG